MVFMAADLNEVKRNVRADFSLTHLYVLMASWLIQRPAIAANNNDLPSAVNLLVREGGEIDELQEEVDRPSDQLEQIDRFLETIDVLWVALGIAFHARLPVEVIEMDAKANMNGAAGRSNFFERLKEVAGNLSPVSLQDDLTYFLSLALSHLAEYDQIIDLNTLSWLVFLKNRNNHVELALSDIDHQSGQVLGKEALQIRCVQVARLLKVIRYGLINLGLTDIIRLGMLPQDWFPYKEILLTTPDDNVDETASHLQALVAGRIIDPQVIKDRTKQRNPRLVDHHGRKIL